MDKLIDTIEQSETMDRIVRCSKRAFLQHGFKDASLRNIAAEAGLTTGAIYQYFKNKDDLFEHIVSPLCTKLEALMAVSTDEYQSTKDAPGEISIEKSIRSVEAIYSLLYAHYDETKLLADCAEGSSRADYFHQIVQYDVDNTMAYIQEHRKFTGTPSQPVDEFLVHMLAESYLNSLLEPIRHNMDYEEALRNIKDLCIFYTHGWMALLNPEP
jgi:AcrR family transcriptional regulator